MPCPTPLINISVSCFALSKTVQSETRIIRMLQPCLVSFTFAAPLICTTHAMTARNPFLSQAGHILQVWILRRPGSADFCAAMQWRACFVGRSAPELELLTSRKTAQQKPALLVINVFGPTQARGREKASDAVCGASHHPWDKATLQWFHSSFPEIPQVC